MKNRKADSGIVWFTAGSDISSGDVIDLTNQIAIAQDDVANGDDGIGHTNGIFELAKDNSVAMSVGDAVFWDSGNSEIDKTASSQTYAGICAKDAAETATLVLVDINKGSRAQV